MLELDNLTLWVLCIALWWLFASIAVGKAAGKRGMDSGVWFFLSLVLGPLFTVILLVAYPVSAMADKVTGDGLPDQP